MFSIVCSSHHVSTDLCHITVLWTLDSERILALVLQLYERNKLKVKYKKTLFESKLPLFWELLEFPYNAVPDRTVLPHGESFYPRNAMLARVQLWP